MTAGGTRDTTEVDGSAERALFSEERPQSVAFAACDLGVARISIAADRVGHAGLLERGPATSVAANQACVVAGTVRGVIGDWGDGFDRLGDAFEVAAVSAGEQLLAAGADGRVVTENTRRKPRALARG